MVSIRRRKLLGLCSGRTFLGSGPNSLYPLPLVDTCHQLPIKDAMGVSSNLSGSSASEEKHDGEVSGRDKKRKKGQEDINEPIENKETSLMRGVYFKNMKWQAAIKVDKKQIHLGTVGSQHEAAHLYDRAAFMCGRKPNFELSVEEKQELRQYKWEQFLAMTRQTITNKKQQKRILSEELKLSDYESSSSQLTAMNPHL